MFDQGKALGPPGALLSAGSYFYLAYKFPTQTKFYSYVAAGVLALSIIPYTGAAMQPTNKKLIDKAEETKTLSFKDEVGEAGLGEETAHKLVDHWGVLNLGRGVLMLCSAVLGAWTALE